MSPPTINWNRRKKHGMATKTLMLVTSSIARAFPSDIYE